MTETEKAYIAGLFDGEGCVTCKQRKTKRNEMKGSTEKLNDIVQK